MPYPGRRTKLMRPKCAQLPAVRAIIYEGIKFRPNFHLCANILLRRCNWTTVTLRRWSTPFILKAHTLNTPETDKCNPCIPYSEQETSKKAHTLVSKHSLRPLRGVIPNLGLMNSSNEGPIHGHTAKSHESSHSCFSGTCVVYTVCADENGEPKTKKKKRRSNQFPFRGSHLSSCLPRACPLREVQLEIFQWRNSHCISIGNKSVLQAAWRPSLVMTFFFPVDVHVEDLSFRGCFSSCFDSLYPFSALVFLQGSLFVVRSFRGYASSWIALVSFRFPWASKLMFLI